MKMRQMMLLMVVGVGMMSTGCTSVRGMHASLFPTPTPADSVPHWMSQPEDEVVLDKLTGTLRVHIDASRWSDPSMQRSICALEARHTMAVYMGWANVQTTTTGGKTTTKTQFKMGHTYNRVVDVEYWTEDFMNPYYHCVGIVKIKASTPTTPVK